MKFHEPSDALGIHEAKGMHPEAFHHAETPGMARSDMTHMIMCMDSGIREIKSQNVSCAEAACGIS